VLASTVEPAGLGMVNGAGAGIGFTGMVNGHDILKSPTKQIKKIH